MFPSGLGGLVKIFATFDVIREATTDALAVVRYVDEENAAVLQTALEDVEAGGEADPTPPERSYGLLTGHRPSMCRKDPFLETIPTAMEIGG
jgi:hypothetical protein